MNNSYISTLLSWKDQSAGGKVCEKKKKPTVFLVCSLVPMERLQEAEDLSKL